MQGWSVLPFFSTKKNSAPAREEEGQIMSAASAPWMYSSLAFLYGPEREYTLGWHHPRQEVSVGQGECRSNDMARILLKKLFHVYVNLERPLLHFLILPEAQSTMGNPR